MKKSTVALIVVLGTLGVIAVATVFGAVVWFAINGISTKPSSEDEKKVVVDAAAVAEYGADVDPKCGKYTTTRNFDQSFEISYECESESVYVLSTTEVNASVRDARQMFLINIGAYKAGVAIGGDDATLQRRDDLLGNLGEDHYAALLRSGNKNAGNVFIVRHGRVVHSVMLTGIYFDEAESAQELLAPVVEEAKKQYARKKKR